MMLHGWCERCHKIKRVRVSRFLPGRTPTGICQRCIEDEDDKRRGRTPLSRCRGEHRHYGRCLTWRCGCGCGVDYSDAPQQ